MRYFIVMFLDGRNHGSINFKIPNYPNSKAIIQAIKDFEPQLNAPTISNIIELNEEDYNSFVGEE